MAALTRSLNEALHRPDLWRLAPNPLLLTVMALVHTHKGRLPDARALLYEETVDILLWRWEQIKAGGGAEEVPQLRQLLLQADRSDVDLKRVLWRLAFEAHAQGGAGGDGEAVADIGELRLLRELGSLCCGDLGWAQKVVEAMKLRAGLLIERQPEVFTFPHRTFQEYLAGAHLAAQADFARRAAGLVAEGAQWREVITLGAGKLVYLSGDLDKPLALVAELCPSKAHDTDLGWQKVWLAGDVLLEVGLSRVNDLELGRDLLERVRERLAELATLGRLEPVERARAGDTLGRLGDPRPGVGMRSDGPSTSSGGTSEQACRTSLGVMCRRASSSWATRNRPMTWHGVMRRRSTPNKYVSPTASVSTRSQTRSSTRSCRTADIPTGGGVVGRRQAGNGRRIVSRRTNMEATSTYPTTRQ